MHLVTALPDAIAVVRPGDTRLAQRLRDAGLRIVECAHADDGMGASLACGVAATADADGWVVALADMPWIAPATIARSPMRLRQAPISSRRRIAASAAIRSASRAAITPSLAALTGDAGARIADRAHPRSA